ncbi:MAG: pesticin C-terminus-like muramidase, partial [Vibrio sp.]
LNELQQASALVESLNSAVEAAKAELADIQEQKTLLSDALTELKESALLMSAPSGIAQVTPKTIQLAAGNNITASSRQHTNVTSLKNITMAAGQAVSVFAQKMGIKAFAAQGKVEIQAQDDEMALDSLKDMRLRSNQGQQILSAKEGIILSSGGAYIKIKDGEIELGAPNKVAVKSAVLQKLGPASHEEKGLMFQKSSFQVTPQVARVGSSQLVEGANVNLTSSASAANVVSSSTAQAAQPFLDAEEVVTNVAGGFVSSKFNKTKAKGNIKSKHVHSSHCKIQIDFDFIKQLEGFKLEGYVPDPKNSQSGVTIATGFDLGARNLNDLYNLRLSDDVIELLTPYLGLKKEKAVKALKEKPLVLNENQAKDIESKVKFSETKKIVDLYNTTSKEIKFECLPWQAQTVIASVSYQYGYLPTETPNFWKQAINRDWGNMYKNLNDFGDETPSRRRKEAKLIKGLL